MNVALLNNDVQSFIEDNLNSNLNKILLAKPYFEGVSNSEIVEQIEAKKRSKTKLPTWYSTPNIIFANKKNLEQSSSEITAKYKSTLLKERSLIDLTGGFGIDVYYFAKHFEKVTHCEINKELSNLVQFNFAEFGIKNVIFSTLNGIEFLKQSKKEFDCIYVDPSRRHNLKGKVFYLKDCEPNIVKYIDLLISASKNVLIKVSPMLDISVAMSELMNVKEIHIVAVRNEVKELLFLLEKEFDNEPKIKTINFGTRKNDHFEFYPSQERRSKLKTSSIKKYLYEPNVSIMKAGAFNFIAEFFEVDKLHKHSHLYTSNDKVDFPGKMFEVEEVIEFNKKTLKRKLKRQKFNISTRNFPIKPEELQRLFGLKSGGEQHIFFTTYQEEKRVAIICNPKKRATSR